ncbi:hypothetical protein JCM33374_g2369 [Metschnikowia sp. JCM 33374]|nr:hypothetical protein JCM33374_g2369 [Metschnikowia sp. JCM 33374]
MSVSSDHSTSGISGFEQEIDIASTILEALEPYSSEPGKIKGLAKRLKSPDFQQASVLSNHKQTERAPTFKAWLENEVREEFANNGTQTCNDLPVVDSVTASSTSELQREVHVPSTAQCFTKYGQKGDFEQVKSSGVYGTNPFRSGGFLFCGLCFMFMKFSFVVASTPNSQDSEKIANWALAKYNIPKQYAILLAPLLESFSGLKLACTDFFVSIIGLLKSILLLIKAIKKKRKEEKEKIDEKSFKESQKLHTKFLKTETKELKAGLWQSIAEQDDNTIILCIGAFESLLIDPGSIPRGEMMQKLYDYLCNDVELALVPVVKETGYTIKELPIEAIRQARDDYMKAVAEARRAVRVELEAQRARGFKPSKESGNRPWYRVISEVFRNYRSEIFDIVIGIYGVASSIYSLTQSFNKQWQDY